MREGKYAVIFKRPDGREHMGRRPAGGTWYFSGCLPGRTPFLYTLERALREADRNARATTANLIYDIKRMA